MKKPTHGKIAQKGDLRKTGLIGTTPDPIGRQSMAFKIIRKKRSSRTWRAITNTLNRELRYLVTMLKTPSTEPG